MVIEGPSDKLKSDFVTIGNTMTDEWLARAGDAGKAVIDAYKAM